ncbi:MAG: glycosyltransferase family 4 protein [Methylococcaceae bacterium]|nr:MAG: glycosyltransferase family 4 protein [Methylococcaceae bacterium]
MNILLISDVYFPRINGVSTSIDTFRREFLAKGHKVWLIAPDYFIPSEDENHILRISSHYLIMDPEDRIMRYGHALRHLDELRRENFEIIHIQTPFVAHYLGLRLSKELGIPRVETYHTHFEEYFYHYIPLLPRPLMRYAARWFAHHQCNQLQGLVVPSRPMLDVLRHYGITTHAEVIPTGLEPDRFEFGDGASFRAKHDIAPTRPVMLFVGRVAHEKNIGFLLKVTERVRQDIPNVLFIIAGEGPAQESLRNETLRLGLEGNVLFIGYLDRHKELRDCYRCADLFVFSSRTETQGLVLLEAMAQGIPLVSTAELGARSVLCEGFGVHIASEEVDEFAGKAIALLRNPEERQRLAAAGHTYARQWSAASLAYRMLDFYQKTIAEFSHHAPASA